MSLMRQQTGMAPAQLKLKTLKEREDFFVKHPRELAEIAKRNEE